MFKTLLFLLALVMPAVAGAQWREASTPHFVVYSKGDERSLRQAATDLERYDQLLRLALELPPESPGKVKIFLFDSIAEVQKSLGPGGGGVAGYYVGSARGPLAAGIRPEGNPADDFGWAVLYHEYAHHLMLQNFPGFYPRWFVEGFAEFYSSTRILKDNVAEVGRPAWGSQTLRHFDWVPLKTLLTARTAEDFRKTGWANYIQGWLLVHYLNNSPERAGQLRKYLSALNAGADFETAMNRAFGPDAKELEAELRRYARLQSHPALRISFASAELPAVSVRYLSAGEAAAIPAEIGLSRGLYKREFPEFAEDVRKLAARFPDHPGVIGILADTEHLAANLPAAATAADRWLTLHPGNPRALARKALVAIDGLVASGPAPRDRWTAPLKWLTDARTAAPEDPLVLEAFYDGHAARGGLPPPKAQNALFRAMELAPRDFDIRRKVALDFEKRNLIGPAIEAIRPAALSTHEPEDEEDPKKKAKREKAEEKWRRVGEPPGEKPREMLARLEAKLAAAGPTAAGK
jgi:hypothetical protein